MPIGEKERFLFMNFDLFKKNVRESLEKKGYTVREFIVHKPNKKLEAFVIADDETVNDFQVTFYYNELYKLSQNIDLVVENVINTNNCDCKISINKEDLRDFSKLQNNIYCTIINAERNEDLLKEIPYISFCDLAIIFKAQLDSKDCDIASVNISNNMLKVWGVDVSDLLEKALANNDIVLGKSCIKPLYDILVNEMGGIHMDNIDNNNMLYLFGNEKKMYGANCIITHKEILKEFAESRNTDVIILPSSRHEVLLIPYSSSNFNIAELRDMVSSVNLYHVSVDDYLSDNVYIYKRAEDIIEIA